MTLRSQILLLVLLLAGGGSGRAPAQTPPDLSASTSTWSFGRVDQGAEASTTIELANPGPAPVRITRLDPGCGCLVARLDTREIVPGGRASLRLVLRTAGRHGAFSRKVRIHAGDVRRPAVVVAVKGFIDRRWWVATPTVSLGRLSPDEVTRSSFVVHVRPGLELSLDSVTASEPGLALAAAPFGTVAGDHGWTVAVTVKSPPEGRLRAGIEVRVRDDLKPLERVTVLGRVAGDLEITPERLVFGRLDPGRPRSLELTVTSRSGRPIVVAAAAASDPRVQVSVPPGGRPAPSVTLRVTCKAADRGDRIRGRIEIRFTRPSGRRLVVPVSGYAF